MPRLSSSTLPVAALLLTLAIPAEVDAQLMDDVQITTQQLTDGVYMLMGRGGNIGLSVGEDGAFVIDDQFAPLTERILAAISEVTDESVRFVFNTHWHGDHTGGNENMGAAGALIVSEAGGIITDFSGTDSYVFGKQIAAGNPAIQPAMLEILKRNF